MYFPMYPNAPVTTSTIFSIPTYYRECVARVVDFRL